MSRSRYPSLVFTLGAMALAWSASVCRGADWTVTDETFTATVDGTPQKYVLLTPPAFDASAAHDVLIALHGHGSDRWQFARNERDECRSARDVAARHAMLFVSPDYRATTSWMGPAAEADVVQIIAELRHKYRVGRVFICGGSMGGSACLAFAAMHPELIDGVISMNGTANFLEYANFQDAIQASFGGTKTEVPAEYKRRSAEYWPERLTIPVAITASGKDTAVPPDSVLRLGAVLRALGRQVLVIHRPEAEHVTSYDDAVAAFEFVIQAGTGAVADEYRWLRGANYVPSFARNDVQTWMDYDPAIVDSDLSLAEKLRLNCVRVFLQVAVYERDPQRFLQNLENLLQLCEKHQLQLMPVVFDSCFGEFPDLENYRDKDWMACPGQNRLGPEHWPALERYVHDVVGAHAGDRRIVMWDVMNEPYVTSFNTPADREVIHTFLGQALEMVRRQQPTQPLTIGWESAALAVDQAQYVDQVDVIAFHNYTPQLREAVRATQAVGRQLKKPIIINEVVGRPHQSFQLVMPILRDERIGWCFWELMLAKTQFSRENPPYQGLVYPDGRCYDAEEVAQVLDIAPRDAERLFPERPRTIGIPAHSEDGVQFSDGWTRWTGGGPRKQRLHYARQAGATAVWETQGTCVTLIHKVGPDCGRVLVFIDGRPALTPCLDTYAADVEWNHVTQLAVDLPPGPHVATLVTLGQKNDKSSDSYVQIVDLE